MKRRDVRPVSSVAVGGKLTGSAHRKLRIRKHRTSKSRDDSSERSVHSQLSSASIAQRNPFINPSGRLPYGCGHPYQQTYDTLVHAHGRIKQRRSGSFSKQRKRFQSTFQARSASEISEDILKFLCQRNTRTLFLNYDTDNRGFLNEKEFARLIETMGYSGSGSEIFREVCERMPNGKFTNKGLRKVGRALLNKEEHIGEECRLLGKFGKHPQPLPDTTVHPGCDPFRSQVEGSGMVRNTVDKSKLVSDQLFCNLQRRFKALAYPHSYSLCWDVDRDGRVNRADMSKMLKHMNVVMSDEEISLMFDRFRRNQARMDSILSRKDRREDALTVGTLNPPLSDRSYDSASSVSTLNSSSLPDSVSNTVFMRTLLGVSFEPRSKPSEWKFRAPNVSPLSRAARVSFSQECSDDCKTAESSADLLSLKKFQDLVHQKTKDNGVRELFRKQFAKESGGKVSKCALRAGIHRIFDEQATEQEVRAVESAINPGSQESVGFAEFSANLERAQKRNPFSLELPTRQLEKLVSEGPKEREARQTGGQNQRVWEVREDCPSFMSDAGRFQVGSSMFRTQFSASKTASVSHFKGNPKNISTFQLG